MNKMRLSGNKILITGGATGIGFAIARAFHSLGNDILICGRRKDRLDEATKFLPGTKSFRCDISSPEDRGRLYAFMADRFGEINILVNNAGIQRPADFLTGEDGMKYFHEEISTNLEAQLCMLAHFVPMLSKKSPAAVVNVSSGLGFVPLSRFPVYSATKAAIHSLTLSLRHQLKGTDIGVFELIPPTVYDTELKGKTLDKTDWMSSSSDVAAALVHGMETGESEIAVGAARRWNRASRDELDSIFDEINR
jgi:uncharacterized oxidoreductase